jgi:hypothetical protein
MLLFMGTAMALILALGFPMFMTMSFTSMLTISLFFPNINPIAVIQQTINGISSFVLLAIPMFIFAADIMTKGHTANRLVDFVKVFVRHVHGGLGIGHPKRSYFPHALPRSREHGGDGRRLIMGSTDVLIRQGQILLRHAQSAVSHAAL